MKYAFKEEGPKVSASVWASNPNFDKRHLRTIELALRAAWEALKKDTRKAPKLSTEPEVMISQMLRVSLNSLRERENVVPGYNTKIFEKPVVGAEMMSNEGRIRKPDIVFSLCGNRRPGVADGLTDCIFVECKILDQGSKNISAYCNSGLVRFVEGSYAPRMREGMMLAFVRTSQELPGALTKTLGTDASKSTLATDGQLRICGLTRAKPRAYISDHDRNWPYSDEDGGGAPGPIEVRHLWLHV